MPNSIDVDKLRALCHARIAMSPDASDEPQLDQWMARVIEKNVALGRYDRFSSSRSDRHPLSLPEYVDLVVLNTSRERARIRALERGDAAEWNRLRDFLARRAYRVVRQFRDGTQAIADAHDFAHDACLIIFEERYPFDVSFEAWATTILKNLILARYTRSTDALNRHSPPESLDAPRVSDQGAVSTLGDLLSDGRALAPFEKVENQAALRDIIAQLHSRAQQQVLLLAYIDGLDDAQIARRLGKSKQAIYNLRNRALAKLKKLTAEIAAQEDRSKNH